MNRQAPKKGPYQDVQLEALIYEIDQLLRALPALTTKEEQQEQLRETCDRIRTAKLHFFNVLDRYGSHYEDTGKNLVDMAYVAADKAFNLGFDTLHQSLRRHAEEIENARSEQLDK